MITIVIYRLQIMKAAIYSLRYEIVMLVAHTLNII